MDISTLKLFVDAVQKPIIIQDDLTVDIATISQCLADIDYQINAIASIVAKYGLEIIVNAMGNNIGPMAETIFASFGEEFTNKCSKISESIKSISIEEIKEII